MSTLIFITKYEGPKKIFTVQSLSYIGIVSTLDSEVSSDRCEAQMMSLKSILDKITEPADISLFRKALSSYLGSLDMSFVCTSEDSVYCITQGTGMIFVRRSGQVRQVAADGLCVRGSKKDGDEYIATTSEYLDFVGGLDGFNYYFGRYKASEVCEMMETYEDQSSPSGFVSMHVGMEEEEEEDATVGSTSTQADKILESVSVEDEVDGEMIIDKEVQVNHREAKRIVSGALFGKISNIAKRENIHKVKIGLHNLIRKVKNLGLKKVFLIVVFVGLLVLLLRYLPFTEIFRNRDAEYSKFEAKIESYLDEADTQSFTDMSEAAKAIGLARDEIEVLPDASKRYFSTKLKELQAKIDEKEAQIFKISTNPLEEYYALSLLSKSVNVTDLDADKDNIYILDNKSGTVYGVTTDKRSQIAIKSDKLKNATQIAAYEGRIYVLTSSDGVYKVDEDKSVQVLKPDNGWEKISDMKIYASNIYLLDSKKGDIYKYPGGIDEVTFGTVTPYLVAELQGTISDAESMDISGAVYVVGGQKIAKYLTGRREDFFIKFPYKDSKVGDFVVVPDEKGYFVFDSEYEAIYEYSGDGIFAKQYRADSLRNVMGLLATDNGVYVVTDTSILKMP